MASANIMRCYYDILNVNKNSTEDEIRKSYRKLALLHHPDKNGNTIESQHMFTDIQTAYDTLIEKQSRAWYDKHREVLLMSDSSQYTDYTEQSIDLARYMKISCFEDYTNGPIGFYSVYSNVFQLIANEDNPFQGEAEMAPPKFGDADSDYDTIVYTFYAYWMSYTTSKTYVWKEMYDTRFASDRRSSRLAESENKKVREREKKKRNENVQKLVNFVKKLDPRVKTYQQILENKKRERLEKMEKKREDTKQMKLNQYNEWIKQNNICNGDNDSMTDSDTDSDEGDFNYCVACEKRFTNQKTFVNHERSARHKESIAILKQILTEDDITNNVNNNLDDIIALEDLSLHEEQEILVQNSKSKKSKKKRSKNNKAINTPDHSNTGYTNELDSITNTDIIDNKNDKIPTNSLIEDKFNNNTSDNNNTATTKNSNNNNNNNNILTNSLFKDKCNENTSDNNTATTTATFNTTSTFNTTATTEDRKTEFDTPINGQTNEIPKNDTPTEMATPNEDNSDNVRIHDLCSIEQQGEIERYSNGIVKKNVKKKYKKKSTKNQNISSILTDLDLSCIVCKEQFSTRNSLFRHLQESGHSTYKN